MAEFDFFAPTTPAELILIAIIAAATLFHIASLRGKTASKSIDAAEIQLLAQTSPLSPASIAVGWSICWPLLILSMIFHFAVIYVRSAAAFWLLQAVFYLVLLCLTLYLLKSKMLNKYGIPLAGVRWSFLWRAVAVSFLARLALVQAIELERLVHEIRFIEGLAARAAVALVQCLGVGWAAHRCITGQNRKASEIGAAEA